MEEKLILAVSGHPELFDSSSYFYRDRNKKDLAWKKISEEIVQPDDVCRKKWKSLRDTYLKEKGKETEKRSGSAAGSGKRWKFSQILGFLDPFVTPRETTSNMEGVEARIGEDNHLEDQGHPEQSGETVTEPYQSEDGQRTPSSAPVSPVPGPSAPAAEPRGQQRRRARRRPRERSPDGPSEVEQRLLALLSQPPTQPPTPPTPPPPLPLTTDEHFLLSLLPFVQSMPPHLKEHFKYKLYTYAMENSYIVLNLEQFDPPPSRVVKNKMRQQALQETQKALLPLLLHAVPWGFSSFQARSFLFLFLIFFSCWN
ncbi:uncharacterized protein LOC143741262 [Siphateles boraxobius]|uniref:uncharacterized protein LOC143741262 n=1 Tax=Siphateles boraxobius TaxID=180520 RepID=UPI00406332EF